MSLGRGGVRVGEGNRWGLGESRVRGMGEVDERWRGGVGDEQSDRVGLGRGD